MGWPHARWERLMRQLGLTSKPVEGPWKRINDLELTALERIDWYCCTGTDGSTQPATMNHQRNMRFAYYGQEESAMLLRGYEVNLCHPAVYDSTVRCISV